MNRPRFEVADVVRDYGDRFLEEFGPIPIAHRRILKAIADCRTSLLGGHKWQCDSCGHEEISYNSCRNRHCPKCQGAARAEWLDAQRENLLDVPYFHVVFTLPDVFNGVALQNKRRVYAILFKAVSQTLTTIARDPKHLGARIGFLAVLHTWGQNLQLHPHLHCVIPGGGLSDDSRRWISCSPGFFLPVKVLSRFFRRTFVDLLDKAFRAGQLSFHGDIAHLEDPVSWCELLRMAREREWVVYCKPPFGGPEQVLKYLARYTHRVAISNQRLEAVESGNVTFTWKDYAHGDQKRSMTITAFEFLRRFLLHVLPHAFQRIRSYGLLANRSKKENLALCRALIASSEPSSWVPEQGSHPEASCGSPRRCPHCKTGRLLKVPLPMSRPSTSNSSVGLCAHDTLASRSMDTS